ncbi:M23 family metallopeptidase [Candidatus Microgenomates bacterium]|nr:M23 family metallopeptidase [Candidatus Microgenomates bacterium]
MEHSRPLSSLLLLGFVLFFISPLSHAAGIPRLTLEKNYFSPTEFISVLYEGEPTSLTAQLIDNTDHKIEYKAVLKQRDGEEFMDFIPTEGLKPGKYALKVWKDNDKLIDSFVYWGVEETATPTPRPQAVREFINRDAPTAIEAEKTYTVNLSFVPDHDYHGTVTDLVPFDAIVDATDAAQIKRPELLSLGMPFKEDYEVSEPFGSVNPKEHLGLSYHDGVDFAAPVGTPIFAVDDGEIVPYREANQYGITQAVHHTWGTTFYGHLSTTSAQIGQRVKKGTKIGVSGNTGLSTGPHLHFGMKWQDDFINGLPIVKNKAASLSDQKMLLWEVDAKKGEKVTKSYTFTMPAESTESADLILGPAQSADIPEKYTLEEEKFWNLSVGTANTSTKP